MGIKLDIRIDSDLWNDMDQCFEICNQAADALDLQGTADLLLTDNAAMQALNAQWKNKDKPTNVLSFPSQNPLGPDEHTDQFLGDIAIGYEILIQESELAGKSAAAHLTHLTIHGILHLAGHDHQGDKDAEIMESIEISVMKRLGFADPYSQKQV